jgi:hypothetical protein
LRSSPRPRLSRQRARPSARAADGAGDDDGAASAVMADDGADDDAAAGLTELDDDVDASFPACALERPARAPTAGAPAVPPRARAPASIAAEPKPRQTQRLTSSRRSDRAARCARWSRMRRASQQARRHVPLTARGLEWPLPRAWPSLPPSALAPGRFAQAMRRAERDAMLAMAGAALREGRVVSATGGEGVQDALQARASKSQVQPIGGIRVGLSTVSSVQAAAASGFSVEGRKEDAGARACVRTRKRTDGGAQLPPAAATAAVCAHDGGRRAAAASSCHGGCVRA